MWDSWLRRFTVFLVVFAVVFGGIMVIRYIKTQNTVKQELPSQMAEYQQAMDGLLISLNYQMIAQLDCAIIERVAKYPKDGLEKLVANDTIIQDWLKDREIRRQNILTMKDQYVGKYGVKWEDVGPQSELDLSKYDTPHTLGVGKEGKLNERKREREE